MMEHHERPDPKLEELIAKLYAISKVSERIALKIELTTGGKTNERNVKNY